MSDMKLLLGAGAVSGAILYSLIVVRLKVHLDKLAFSVCAFAGILFVLSLHMAYAVYHPHHLVHVTDAEHKPLDPAQYHFELNDFHAMEILVTALGTLALSLHLFSKFLPRKSQPANNLGPGH